MMVSKLMREICNYSYISPIKAYILNEVEKVRFRS